MVCQRYQLDLGSIFASRVLAVKQWRVQPLADGPDDGGRKSRGESSRSYPKKARCLPRRGCTLH